MLSSTKFSDTKSDPLSCTEFQVYRFHQDADYRIVKDFTLRKLRSLIREISRKNNNDLQVVILEKMLLQYKQRSIAISWSHGKPFYIKITKE